MRGLRVFGASWIVGCVICASAAGTASAGASHVLWKSEGKAVSTGTAVYGEAILGFDGITCVYISRSGTVTANDRVKDKAGFTPGVGEEARCEGGAAITGQMERMTTSSSGEQALIANPKITIETPGPCVYTFRKLEGAAGIPGFSAAEVSAVGRRQAASSHTCATSVTAEGELELFDAETAELFETEIAM